jgi:hypothetical protein
MISFKDLTLSEVRGAEIPGGRSPVATAFCTVAPNTRISSVWNLFRVTLLAPRILGWLLDFFENLNTPLLRGLCAGLLQTRFQYGHMDRETE